MKSRIEHVAVVAPVCSKHDNDALVFRCSLLQSLSDFGGRIGAFGVNLLLLRSRLTKAESAPGCDSERETQHQNPPIEVHLDLLHSWDREVPPEYTRETTLPEPQRKRSHYAAFSVSLAGVHQLQAVALQDALDLMFGVHGPGAGGVKLHVGTPVLQRLARLAYLLIGQCDVVVRVGVGGRELNRGLIRVDSFFDASGFVEYVAQVEIGERVAGIDLNRRTVVPFGERVFLAVVVQRAQIDVRGGVNGIHFENL